MFWLQAAVQKASHDDVRTPGRTFSSKIAPGRGAPIVMASSFFVMVHCSLAVFFVASLACYWFATGGVVNAQGAKVHPLEGRPLFHRSGDVGVTHCALPGIVKGQHIMLHVWVRAFLQPAAPSLAGHRHLAAHGSGKVRLHVKGFTTLENLEQYPDNWKIHVEEHSGPVAKEFRPNAYLRPQSSSIKLNLSSSHSHLWTLSGDFELDSEKQQGEFELGIYGLKYMCNVVATWQDDEHSDRSAAGLERPGQTAMLISPYFGYSATEVASLLAWHVAWHRRLGVDVYVLYATKDLVDLLDVPQIKALVLEGTLHLILWQDMALGDPEQTSKAFSRYAHQTQIYNHAMLVMHAKDTIVLVADLDEYLVTPRPMSVRQVLSDCLPNQGVVGAMRLVRYNVFHKESIQRRQGELPLWILGAQSSLPDVAEHPLKGYSICANNCTVPAKYARPTLMQAFKSIYSAMHVTDIWVHHGFVQRGAVAVDGDAECARWLHVVNQNSLRIGGEPEMTAFKPGWLWPALPKSS